MSRFMYRVFVLIPAFLALSLSSLAWSQASTQTYTYEVLIDVDRSAATGCSVTPTGGAAQEGIEQRLTATVEISGGSGSVTALERRECSGSAFGAPIQVTPPIPPWPVNFDGGVAGADALELAVARADIVDTIAGSIALTFVGENATGSDVLATIDGSPTGAPILLSFSQPPVNIPVLSLGGLVVLLVAVLVLAWVAHRRFGRIGTAMAVMLVATAAWAMNFAVDGDLSDWTGLAPAGQDPTGDATNGRQAIDLVAAFAAIEDDRLYFRIDAVDMETQPPAAVDDVFDAVLGTVDTGAVAPGILANDTLGVPEATLVDYGPAGTRGTLPGNPYTLPGSGGVTVTVEADGALTIGASAGTAVPGDYLFEYEIENAVGADTAEVAIQIIEAPTAQPDTFTFAFDADQAAPASLFADNGAGPDALGTPAATLVSFGGGDLGGAVGGNAAGASVALAGGTLTVGADGSWSLTGQPFDPGSYSFDYRLENSAGNSTATVTLNIQSPPDAIDDAYETATGETLTVPVSTGVRNANDAWTLTSTPSVFPDASISAFGDVGSPAVAPGNPYSLTGSGGITVTLAADGSFVVDATAGTAVPGVYTFAYTLANGTTDDSAVVTIDVREAPALQPDAFTFQADIDQPTPASLFADNGAGPDELGTPAGTLTSFGGGDLGGAVGDNPAGSAVPFAGGILTVDGDGSWSLTGQPFDPGPHTFEYRVENIVGSDTATVTVNIDAAPEASPDAFEVTLGTVDSGASVLANDTVGVPPAVVDFYADTGDIGGGSQVAAPGVYTHPVGNFTVTIAGSGDIVIDASVGGVVPGVGYAFDYQITNASGSSVATVTVDIVEAPAPAPHLETIGVSADQIFGAGAGLFVDNGAGPDALGTPAATIDFFGGGDLGGAVTDNAAGTSVSLAGGTLTVNTDGSWSLTGQPFSPGTYTFDYQLTNSVGSASATVTLNIQAPPTAVADAYEVALGASQSFTGAAGVREGNDDYTLPNVFPDAVVDFYADSGDIGGGSQVAAPGVYTHPTGGFEVTIAADGDITVDATGVGVTTGSYAFDYQLTNSAGSSVATVTVDIVQAPTAVGDDLTVANGTAVAFDAPAPQFGGVDLTADNGNGVDDPGSPPFDTIEFGGGDLGGTVTDNPLTSPGSITLPFAAAGGDLTVASTSAGAISFSLAGTSGGTNLIPGRYDFQYRLTNSVGTSAIATVTFEVFSPPTAVDDDPTGAAAFTVPVGSSDSFTGAAGVRVRNDDYTLPNVFPEALVSGYADVGDLGGASEVSAGATYTVPGSGGVTVTITAAGDLSIDATAGTAVAGTYSFEYGLSNGTTDDGAIVTFNIDAPATVTQAEVEQNDPADAFVTLPELGGTAPVVTFSPDLSFSFSESVTFNAGAISIACSISGDVSADYTASATPAAVVGLAYTGAGLSAGETCSVVLTADSIVDAQSNTLDGNGNGVSDGSPTDDEFYQFVVDTAPGLASVEVEVGDTFTTIAGSFAGAGGVTNTDTDTTIRTTFTEPVNDNGGTTVTCGVSGSISSGGAGLTVTGNGTNQLVLTRNSGSYSAGETCTVTFTPANLTDVDAADLPDGLTTPSPLTYEFEVAPVATDDGFSATTHLEARFDTVAPGTTNLLSNDLPAGASVAEVNGSAANVGIQLALGSGAYLTVEADGDFNYVPAPGATGGATDAFTYTVNAPNGSSATATVTMTIDGAVIWYVDADATGPIYNGTAAFPFDHLAGSGNDFDGSVGDVAGATIFVYDSASDNSAVQCGLELLDNQVVIGEGESATLNALTGRSPVAETVAAPETTGAQPQLASTGSCFTLGNGNTVRGLDIGNTGNGYAFANGGATVGAATISDVAVSGTGGILSIVNGGTLNATFSAASANSAADTEIELVNVNGTLNISGGSIAHTNASSGSVSISGGNISGTIAASFNQTAGNSPLIRIQGGHTGTLTFSAAMAASAGTGLQFDNADGTYNLQGVLSVTAGTAGLNVANGSDGTLNVTNTSSSIAGIQGTPFRVNNSTMAIDYNGEVFHRAPALLSARAVEIIGGTGAISLDGQVIAGDNVTRTTAEAVYLENTGSTNTITLNYVDAVTDNTTALRSLTSGNVAMNRLRVNCQGDLTIGGDTHCVQLSDTTSSGFTVEAMAADLDDAGEYGGALSLINTPGTWTVEDISGALRGRFQTTIVGNNFGALNLATVNSPTSPGASATGSVSGDQASAIDLQNGTLNALVGNLQSFNTATGLRLVNVGGAGLEVQDGQIPNMTADSVILTDTGNVTLNSVEISGSAANGILGQNVTNFTLSNSLLTNNGDAVNEGGLRFANLLGTATISGTTITGSAEHNIEIINTSGVLNPLTVSNSTIGTNSATLGSDGLLLETRNSASATVIVTNSTFEDNRSDGIQISAIDNSVATLVVNDTIFRSTLDASPAGSVGARGIVLSASTNSNLNFDIGTTTSNTFENFSPNIGEEAINVTLISTSTTSALLQGRINNNTFTNSGGAVGIDVRGNGALVMEIDGNTATTSRQAIDVITGDGATDSATADVTITNNQLTVAGTAANPNNEAVGWLGDFNTTSCLVARGNTGSASGTRPDFLIDDFTTAGGAVNIERGPDNCGGSCASSVAHLLANNTITDAISSAGLVTAGTCVTVP